MSGMVECYLINDAGEQCDFTPAVTNTRVIFGKNQPFLCVEITVSKYLFDSDDFWSGQTQEGQETLTRPELTQNSTPIHIKTYGGEYDLIYTQTLNPDDMTYVFLCYSKMWQAKTTKVTSLISQDIVWNGQSDSYSTGNLTISCNGFTTTSQVGGTFTPQNGNGDSVKNVQIINASSPIDLKSVRHFRQPWRDYKEVSNITVGTLRVLVPIYRDESIPPLEGQGGTDELPDFNDLNGTLRADTVYASIIFDYTCPLSAQDNEMYYEEGRRSITQAVTHPSNYVQQNVGGQMVTSSTTEDDGVLYCKGIEYICGFGQTLFAWMANKIGGYTGSQLTIDQGYIIETSENILAKLDYTSAELQAYKNKTVEERIHGDTIFKIQPDILANDLITTVANATNRHAFFADTPYLASFEISGEDALSELTIKYTAENGAYCAYYIPLGETEPQQIVLGSGVQYDDQGSTYLVGQQTARSPNTSVTVKVTDAGTDTSGMPIEVNLNTESIEGNKDVLAQIAFNRLVQNYHPSNTLSFIALENTSTQIDTDYVAYMKSGTGFPEPSAEYVGRYYVNAGADDVNLYSCQLVGGTYTWVASVTPAENDTVTVHAPSNTYFFRFLNGAWVQFSYIVTVDRHELFRPDTRCATLEDVRSHTTLKDVPLAYTVLSWPDCCTRYMFGEPIFQDTETTIAELQAIAKQTVTNTSVTEALNKPYVATAIGNMSLDEAGDDLTDFTGLILQKNESTGVASMDGYAGGQRQARFSSDGSISSGVVTYHSPRSSDPTALTEAGDSVIMDRNGFHTRSWHLYPYTAPEYAYTDGYWIEEASIGVDGMISAGAGSVTLGADGLVNYDSEGEPAYTLDDEGLKYKGQPIINSENGKIQLKVDGAAIDGNLRAVSITLPYVQIDNEGLRTFDRYFWDTDNEEYQYFTGDLQCSVGTNGVITAGAGAVKLDQYGLSTWTGVVASDILGGWDYSNATRQCAVTTSGELIAGANLYKLDASGLSYNFGQGTSLVNWQNILRYNATEHRVELYPSIYVEAAEIESLSADKITSGTIQAGVSIKAGSVAEGWSILDSSGLKIYSKGVDPTTQQSPREPAVWMDADGYHMQAGATSGDKAEIKYGTWANHISGSQDVRASVNLLSNVSLNAGPVCAEYGQSGDTVHYAVTLNDMGLSTYDYTYDTDSQHSGYATNVQQILQCSIGTNGKIIAGANLVTLSKDGILVGTSADAPPSLISLGPSSSFEILDNTSSPAISLSQGGSTFRNDVNFEKSIAINGGAIKLGDIGTQVSTGNVSVVVTQGSTSQTSSSQIVNMTAASGEVLSGKLNPTLADYTYILDQLYDSNGFSIGFDYSKFLPMIDEGTKVGLLSWVSRNNIKNALLLGQNCSFSYTTAKSPEKWPEFMIKFQSLEEYQGFVISDLLRTEPHLNSGNFQIAGHTEFNFSLGFGANSATDATLAEIVEVTLEYYTATYDSSASTPSVIGTTLNYQTQTLSLYANDSGLKTFKFVLPQQFSRENGVIRGTYVAKISGIKVLIKLPLTRTVRITPILAGTLAASGEGSFFVSRFGAWGATPVIDASTLKMIPNGIAPMVNTAYLSSTLAGYSTEPTTLGLKRIKAAPYGSSVSGAFNVGDIVLFYRS